MLSKKNTILIFTLTLILSCMQCNAGKSRSYVNFPPALTPSAPHDVDVALQKKLVEKKQFDEVQRLFDILAWQNFISLNWPTQMEKPMPKLSDQGRPVWSYWKESYEVYKNDGGVPLPWGESEFPSNFRERQRDSEKVLFRTGKFTHHHAKKNNANVDDEIDQAFTTAIWDQNGNIVRYEVLMNQVEFDYLVENKLYNIDGQIAFSKKGKSVAFPSANREQVGAIELKIAWKIVDREKDIPSRFLLQDAWVMNEDGSYSKAWVGMVGMHIALKTKSSPQWIWATFEHVDNLEANPLKRVNGKSLKALFYDSSCQICPVNVYPNLANDYSAGGLKRNQIQRVLPIAKATRDLNARVQDVLMQDDSVLQYYQLVGTQWPTEPKSKPYRVASPSLLPEAVTNKSGGFPTPTYLTNMVMETYFQGATTVGKGNSYYNIALANIPAWRQIQGGKAEGTNNKRIFGTESCMGCHYSASIAVGEKVGTDGNKVAISGAPATADFSWLLSLKAKFITSP